MTDETTGGAHWSFWTIAVLALIWNVLGCINFVSQMNPEAVAAMPESYRAAIQARPDWATGAFAIAVFGGVLGCIVLLLRKFAAYYVFIASLLAALVAIVQFQLAVGFDPIGAFIGSAMQLVVAAFLVWYVKQVHGKGWIR